MHPCVRTGIAFDLSLMASRAGIAVGLSFFGKGPGIDLNKIDTKHFGLERMR
jgi:hypothetical protein